MTLRWRHSRCWISIVEAGLVGVDISILLAPRARVKMYSERKHSDKARWICVYPAYVNNKKTVAEGRRISKAKCVENPTYHEIRDVLAAAGLTVGVENKIYCREPNKDMTFRGRVRVHMKNDDGTPVMPNFPSRDSVLLYLGEMIPKLKTRQQKPVGSEQSQPQQSSSKKGKGKKGGKR